MSVRPWPELRAEDQWLIEAMEERLANTQQSADRLRARARELRRQAEQSDIRGLRDAGFALAARFEQAASRRLDVG